MRRRGQVWRGKNLPNTEILSLPMHQFVECLEEKVLVITTFEF